MSTFDDTLAGAAVARARRTGAPEDARHAAALTAAHLEALEERRERLVAERTVADRLLALWLRVGVDDGETIGQFIASGKATREELLAAGLTPDDLKAAGAWVRGRATGETA